MRGPFFSFERVEVVTSSILPSIVAKISELRGHVPDLREGRLRAPAGGESSTVSNFVRDSQMKTMCFECPPNDYSKAPDVDVAARKGTKIFMVRWQIHFPGVELRCTCGGLLKGKRWATTTKRLVFPGGVRGYAMQYIEQCPIEGTGFCRAEGKRQTFGHTGRYILEQVEAQFGRHARRMYPVDPAYAFPRTAFHLTEAVSKAVEASIVTYLPGDVIAKNFKISGRELYDEDAADYDSFVGRYNAGRIALQQDPIVFSPFPEFDKWVGLEMVGGAAVRGYFTDAWFQARRDERNIEMQQVCPDPGGLASIDHTFATIKNLSQPEGLPKLTSVFDVVDNRSGKVLAGVCVSSTSICEYVDLPSLCCVVPDKSNLRVHALSHRFAHAASEITLQRNATFE